MARRVAVTACAVLLVALQHALAVALPGPKAPPGGGDDDGDDRKSKRIGDCGAACEGGEVLVAGRRDVVALASTGTRSLKLFKAAEDAAWSASDVGVALDAGDTTGLESLHIFQQELVALTGGGLYATSIGQDGAPTANLTRVEALDAAALAELGTRPQAYGLSGDLQTAIACSSGRAALFDRDGASWTLGKVFAAPEPMPEDWQCLPALAHDGRSATLLVGPRDAAPRRAVFLRRGDDEGGSGGGGGSEDDAWRADGSLDLVKSFKGKMPVHRQHVVVARNAIVVVARADDGGKGSKPGHGKKGRAEALQVRRESDGTWGKPRELELELQRGQEMVAPEHIALTAANALVVLGRDAADKWKLVIAEADDKGRWREASVRDWGAGANGELSALLLSHQPGSEAELLYVGDGGTVYVDVLEPEPSGPSGGVLPPPPPPPPPFEHYDLGFAALVAFAAVGSAFVAVIVLAKRVGKKPAPLALIADNANRASAAEEAAVLPTGPEPVKELPEP